MGASYFLPNGSSGWEDVQLMRGALRVYPYHVCMVLGEYVGVCRQCLLQLGLLFLRQEGIGIGTPVQSANDYGLQGGSIANCSLSSKAARMVGHNLYENG